VFNRSLDSYAWLGSTSTPRRKTLRLTRGRKQLGVGVLLEDIQAQQELLKARGDLVTIVTELNQQQYALLHSVGVSLHKP